MATELKILGQSDPLAATLTTVYTVPLATETVVSSLVVCNRGVATSFRIAVSPGGAGISNEHYIYYDVSVGANATFASTLGIALSAADVIRVYGTLATCSFSFFGQEIT